MSPFGPLAAQTPVVLSSLHRHSIVFLALSFTLGSWIYFLITLGPASGVFTFMVLVVTVFYLGMMLPFGLIMGLVNGGLARLLLQSRHCSGFEGASDGR
jgi:hypothetical protein